MREVGAGGVGSGPQGMGGGKFNLELSIGGCLITSTVLGTMRLVFPHSIRGRHKAADSTT